MEPAGRDHAGVRQAAGLNPVPPVAAPAAADAFLEQRPMLLSLAYRLLGSVHEAEDTVQDAYLRWSALGAAERDEVANPAAYLTTVTTRLGLDRLRSAASRREFYVGSWLPEPLPASVDAWSDRADPAERAALRDSASMGVLLLLDRLDPAERAVFVLREAFGVPYPEIAAILERSEESCRQLLSRARRRLTAEPRRPAQLDPEQARLLVDAFLAAAQGGDLARLESLLREDVVLTTDGNGMSGAGRRPIFGAAKAARLHAKVFERFYAAGEIRHAWYNGAPAVEIRTPLRRVVYVFDFDEAGLIAHVYAVLNPEKLSHLD
ncbi:RNA polymerase sigma factor SigJ [Streptacidiphilus fuscans]|uniref:RNA polymerase sigma factor SigJ n=1 Tax=Streptacidiphilus fuscans TaxID=2789292 RepID=A0A931B5L7_9ACTN|nr:RNA polymerase sigma factor SigJ [Streptacidiphilus fuscans]MBF9070693.1 RNA polymerase sigma factor SigJ [Streptacidiphilus fuscans]